MQTNSRFPSSESDARGYYAQAVAALNNDDFKTASRLCEAAGDDLERDRRFNDASIAYDLLGLVHYRSGALEDAKSSYLKSISLIDQAHDKSDLEYAKTCHSLAAVVNAMGDQALAIEWLSKSLEIRERLQDRSGLGYAYHQMGIVEHSRSNLEEARRWYKKAISVQKDENDIAGLIATVRWLASTMGDEDDPEAVDKVYEIATDAIERTGDAMIAKTAADQARKDFDFRAATEFYRKAFALAENGKLTKKAGRRADIINRIKRRL